MGIPPIDGHIRVVDDDEGEELDCRSHGRRVNGNHRQLGEIPILWQLVKSVAVNTHC